MDFRNGKMPRSHVDTAYAAPQSALSKSPRSTGFIEVNKKQSEISGFELIKWCFRLNFEIYAILFHRVYSENFVRFPRSRKIIGPKPFKPSWWSPKIDLIFLQPKVLERKFPWYWVIFFNFETTSSHLYPLQVGNCDSNSRLVVDEDDNEKFRLEKVKVSLCLYFQREIMRMTSWKISWTLTWGIFLGFTLTLILALCHTRTTSPYKLLLGS